MANKKSRAAKPPSKELTAVELEMMNVIWRIGPCSVAQVQEQLLRHWWKASEPSAPGCGPP